MEDEGVIICTVEYDVENGDPPDGAVEFTRPATPEEVEAVLDGMTREQLRDLAMKLIRGEAITIDVGHGASLTGGPSGGTGPEPQEYANSPIGTMTIDGIPCSITRLTRAGGDLRLGDYNEAEAVSPDGKIVAWRWGKEDLVPEDIKLVSLRFGKQP